MRRRERGRGIMISSGRFLSDWRMGEEEKIRRFINV